MLKKIEALRLQPKHVRNRYAFWSALTITFVIACIWVLIGLVPKNTPETTVAEDVEVESSLSRAWYDLTTTVETSFSQFRAQTTYVQEDENVPSAPASNIIDLDALLASSSPHRLMPTSTTDITDTVASGTLRAPQTEPIATSTGR